MASKTHRPHGAGHFLQERISSAALTILAPVFAVLLVLGADGSLAELQNFLSNPLNAWVSAAFLLVSLWHMMMGMDVVIDDYIAKPAGNGLLKTLNYAACLAAAGGGLYAIYVMKTTGA
jgi:succinate dehydrogenase / fumarate reductase membrane anchor subunit